ncbi:MAG: hypothetical protein ACP6IQ_01915 [Candidatus Njordarchaeia archaeon]
MARDYIFQLGSETESEWELDLNDDCFKGDIYFDSLEVLDENDPSELTSIVQDGLLLPANLLYTKEPRVKQLPFELTITMRSKFLDNLGTYTKNQFIDGVKLLAELVIKPNDLVLHNCLKDINPRLATTFFWVPELMSILYNPQRLWCENLIKNWLLTSDNIYIQQIYTYHW